MAQNPILDKFGQGSSSASRSENPILRNLSGSAQQQDTNAEEPGIFQGSNTLFKLIDAMNTPQQAIYGAGRSLQQGNTDIFSGAAKGTQKNLSGVDLLKGAGVPELGSIDVPVLGRITGRGAIGLYMDIFTDPMLGLGKLSKALGLGQKLAAGATKVTPKFLGGRLGVQKAEGQVLDLMSQGRIRLQGGKGKILRDAAITRKGTKQAAKELGITAEEAGRRISAEAERILPRSVQEGIDMTVNTSFKVKSTEARVIAEEATKLRKVFDDQLLREKALGLGTIGLDSIAVEYIPHIITDSFKKILRSKGDLKRLSLPGTHGFQLARKWRDLTIDEINSLGRQGKLPGYADIKIDQVFKTDPSLVHAVRGLAGEKAIVDAELLVDSAVQLGKRVGDEGVAAALKSDPSSLVKLNVSRTKDPRNAQLAEFLDDYLFDPEVAQHLNAYADAVIGPRLPKSTLDQFLGIFDNLQAEWKLSTLFIFPAYHSRNLVGNIWNNTLAGVEAAAYKDALKYQATSLDNISARFKLGGREYTKQELDNILLEHGVVNQFRAFIDPQATAGKRVIERIPVVRLPVKAGLATAEFLENNARIAHFMHKLNKGLTPMDAAISTKRYLFDYTDLSLFEQKFMRRVFPFYAWTRKNIPLQIRGLVDSPNQYASLGDITNAMERANPISTPKPEEDRLVYDWIKENSGVRARVNTDGDPEYFLLGGWIPAADLNDISGPKSIFRLGLDNLTPALKLPAEMIFNKDLFLGRDIENFPGEKTKFLGFPVSKRYVVQSLKNIRLLVEADRLLATINETGRKTVFDVPVETSRRGDTPESFIIRTLFGVKLYPVNLAQAERFKFFEAQRLIREKRKDLLRRQSPGINEEQLDRLIDEQLGLSQ